ncbi:site-specific integrase [Paraflavitalea sp. CAU 1676]|uniref:site-specific integrase n=1 Tax=Paraflavitalea sp. CAU 1676 TaxID=3032598 RepID=UPI0023DB495D|nr:site-specific integrase [Paraflavitalea sp. CAU 1676]MDF2189840.1 phage integrase SAM-like domain-containing protein [Paraflavitalea sp. CAU 1676]
MSQLIYPTCDKKRIRKIDGTSKVYLQYNFNSDIRPLLDTNISIPPQYWDRVTRRVNHKLPNDCGSYKELNKEIKRQEDLARDLVRLGIRMKVVDMVAFVKQFYNPELDVTDLTLKKELFERLSKSPEERNNDDLFFQLEEYIKAKKGRVSDKTINIFEQVGQHLRAFEKHSGSKVCFEALDFNFYDAYTRFLTFEYVQERRKTPVIGLKQNSIAKTIKQLRIFVKDRIKRKIIAPIDLSDFKSQEENTDAIYLNFDEIRKLYNLDLNNSPVLAQYRRIFIVACLTGLRFSDFSTITPENIVGEKFILKRQEKSDSPVMVPLREEAKQLLLEYFENKGVVHITNPDLNANVKVIGRMAGITDSVTFSYKKGAQTIKDTRAKCDWISTHTARRSFCTNEFLAGTPIKLIMKISGHKKEKDFYRYIRITEKEAALLIERIWLARDGMQPLTMVTSEPGEAKDTV